MPQRSREICKLIPAPAHLPAPATTIPAILRGITRGREEEDEDVSGHLRYWRRRRSSLGKGRVLKQKSDVIRGSYMEYFCANIKEVMGFYKSFLDVYRKVFYDARLNFIINEARADLGHNDESANAIKISKYVPIAAKTDRQKFHYLIVVLPENLHHIIC